ncbi:MAG: hypothetical protein EXR79_03815 [Myxococcales bacterium]|nr:hypothetical protein [Myxococcales bacterium]
MDALRTAFATLQRWPLAAAAVVLAVLLLPGLGGPGLLDPWEMDRAAVARLMAGRPRVVVAEGAAPSIPTPGAAARPPSLLAALDKAAPGQYALVSGSTDSDASPMAALTQAVQRLQRQPAHALVVDLDAVVAGVDGRAVPIAQAPGLRDRLDAVFRQLTAAELQNRGTAFVFVTAATDIERLRLHLGAARARGLQRTWGDGILAEVWKTPDLDIALARPLSRGDLVVTRAALADTLRSVVPAPLASPVHKRDGQVYSVPWLEAVLSALSVRTLGASEFAVRLPAALLALIGGLLVVWGTARLLGPIGGWLALLVYATLPLTVGLGRTLTFEATAPLGYALYGLGLALGVAGAAQRWALLCAVGLAVLLPGEGLAGLATAAGVTLAYVLATAERRRGPWLLLLATLAVLGLAAWVVLSHPENPLLRGLRFTQAPFGAGIDATRRDFGWFVGQIGFGLYPWGAPFVLALAGLAGAPGVADDRLPAQRKAAIAVFFAALGPLVAAAAMVRSFQHLVAPAAPMAAVAIAWLLHDALAGRVGGRLVGIYVALATLLLHREIGKSAESVTRFLAFDPPFSFGTGEPLWPVELVLPRPLRAVALVSVLAFCLGVARPAAVLRTLVHRLRRTRPAAWALGGVAFVWGLDALVSLGTRLDVLLKTNAATNGYPYDRLWVTIQATRPELVAGAAVLAGIGALAAGVAMHDRAVAEGKAWLRLPIQLGGLLQWSVVALATLAVCATGVLLAGCAVHAAVHKQGWGVALGDGVRSSAFLVPAVAFLGICVLRWLLPRGDGGSGHWLDPLREHSLFGPLLIGLHLDAGRVLGALGLCAAAGIGIGASQAAGTWTYGYLAAVWGLFLALGLTTAGTAQYRPGGYGWVAAGLGTWVFASLFAPLALRYVAETAADGSGPRYLLHALLTSPDAGAFVGVGVALVLNRLAAEKALLARLYELLLRGVGRLEHPRTAAIALGIAGVAFTTGFAWTLLPGLSLHYSQKHLLVRIADAGGAGNDKTGAPRTFSHGSGRSSGDSNFYLQSMPAIDDRSAVLDLLAGKAVQTRITLYGEGGTREVKLDPLQRFVVVPRDGFSELNHAFRMVYDGRHVPVLDAASSRLVLCATSLNKGQDDQNWIGKALLTPAAFEALPGIKRIDANFENSIHLVGYQLAEYSVARAQKYRMTFYWKVAKPTSTSWKLFMHPHPLHLDRWPLTQPDPSEDENKPCAGCFQTNHWLAGDIIVDSFDQEVPLGTNAGPNEIILGWYNPSSDTRMNLVSASGEGVFKHADNRVTIGHLQVR